MWRDKRVAPRCTRALSVGSLRRRLMSAAPQQVREMELLQLSINDGRAGLLIDNRSLIDNCSLNI